MTLSEAVLPPVLGPVMMTARTPGFTQMSIGTGGFVASSASPSSCTRNSADDKVSRQRADALMHATSGAFSSASDTKNRAQTFPQ